MKLHPLSQEFTWQRAPGPLRYVTQEQADAYAEIGGFVLPDAFSPTEVADLLAELDPLEAQSNADLQNIDPNQPTIARPDEIVFRAHAVMVSEQARRFAQHPVMRDLVQDLSIIHI